MVLWLKSGKSSYDVSGLLFGPHSKALYWKKLYEDFGVEGLRTVEKSGRPKSIDSMTEEVIRSELSGNNYWKSSQIISIVQEKFLVKYMQRHVRRLMLRWGYALITPQKETQGRWL